MRNVVEIYVALDEALEIDVSLLKQKQWLDAQFLVGRIPQCQPRPTRVDGVDVWSVLREDCRKAGGNAGKGTFLRARGETGGSPIDPASFMIAVSDRPQCQPILDERKVHDSEDIPRSRTIGGVGA